MRLTMVGHSAILPCAHAPHAALELAEALERVLVGLDQPFEILVVAHGTLAEHELPPGRARAKWLRLPSEQGFDRAALAAVAACRHDKVIVVDSSGRYSPDDVPRLIERLVRHDLVLGRRRLSGWRRHWLWIRGTLRRWALGDPAHDPQCLFWAARRECLQAPPLSPDVARWLPVIVSRTGYRVGELYVDHRPPATPAVCRSRGRLLDLIAAWWLAGREAKTARSAPATIPGRTVRFDGPHPVSPVRNHLTPTTRRTSSEQP